MNRETLVAANPEHELILENEGVLAGPLVSEDSNVVLGMLKIDESDFSQFNPGSMQNFRIVCDWIATAYDRALEFERTYGPKLLPAIVNLRAGH